MTTRIVNDCYQAVFDVGISEETMRVVATDRATKAGHRPTGEVIFVNEHLRCSSWDIVVAYVATTRRVTYDDYRPTNAIGLPKARLSRSGRKAKRGAFAGVEA